MIQYCSVQAAERTLQRAWWRCARYRVPVVPLAEAAAGRNEGVRHGQQRVPLGVLVDLLQHTQGALEAVLASVALQLRTGATSLPSCFQIAFSAAAKSRSAGSWMRCRRGGSGCQSVGVHVSTSEPAGRKYVSCGKVAFYAHQAAPSTRCCATLPKSAEVVPWLVLVAAPQRPTAHNEAAQ